MKIASHEMPCIPRRQIGAVRVNMDGMSEIDKGKVWTMAKNMRLFGFMEYLRDLDNDPAPSAVNQQIAEYLREFMTTDPKLLLGDE